MVLFAHQLEAQECARDQDGRALGPDVKVAVTDIVTDIVTVKEHPYTHIIVCAYHCMCDMFIGFWR